jgi:beta-glucanase (GH16 family)
LDHEIDNHIAREDLLIKTTILSMAFALFLCQFSYAQYQLVWSDEFNYSGLPDSKKWGYDIGGGGWGNQELQYYTKEHIQNARVENGTLVVTARRETIGQKNYSSARLITRKTGGWLYGKIEIAAKLPTGKGSWPAIWMLPVDNEYGKWPGSGEIDIMENVGYDPFRIHVSVHTEIYNHLIGTNKGASVTLNHPHTSFNVYSVEWNEDRIDFFVNKRKVFTFINEGIGYKAWPFDKTFYLILNIAVGGGWGGRQGIDESIFPQEMVIDYVRVYKKSALR